MEGKKMPVLFMGHGSPMNAIEENPYTRAWAELVNDIPAPQSILIISAHWETAGGTKVYAGTKPKMIYDMFGFPQNLYQVQYPCDGDPETATHIAETVEEIAPTHEWGLDHGAWSVLVKMFPDATIPCFQLSLDSRRDFQWHYDLAKQLAFLRNKGVLILGSGNIVHNLRAMSLFNLPAPDWALEFDHQVVQSINKGDHHSLVHYSRFGKAAEISVNSAEHFIPLLYTLALQEPGEPVHFSNHEVEETLVGKMMRCVKIG